MIQELLEQHYDPIYLQSMRRNFAGFARPALALPWDGSAQSLDRVARQIVDAAAAVTPGS